VKAVLRKTMPTTVRMLAGACVVIGIEIVVIGWWFGYASMWSLFIATVTTANTRAAPQIIQDAPYCCVRSEVVRW
jgi:hypothetical protein